ncbi:hypothetical protein [Halomonas sp.]|uniref:hypothetical protein n=1 Tax=Halomonas sp. TaxID=1486246 RepID=UPI003D0E287A
MLNIDARLRHAAFHRLEAITQQYSNDVPWEAIAEPVQLGGDRFFIASRAIGIFKPKQMPDGILSIKTVVPKQGRINIYLNP